MPVQISKLCEALSYLNHKVTLILPNTGNGENYFDFYNINNKFEIIRLKLFNKFPRGLNHYLFSLIAVFRGFLISTDLYITRNYFAAFVSNSSKKKLFLSSNTSN